jgi:ubiquinone/menaquinone biosynthesis C-methylase UbiE
MSNDHIKSYWESQGKDHGASHWASWGDNWMIELEIETVGRYINQGAKVLDVGCANGYSTFQQHKSKSPSSITGLDFATNMIKEANGTKLRLGLKDEVEFIEGDICELPFETDSFDVAYTTRVLINLPTWELQVQGIAECIRVVRPGGTIIFSEGFWEPLVLLNAMRSLKQLPPLVEHDFNRYLKIDRLEKYLSEKKLPYMREDFSSIYYLGSRFLRELVTDANAYPGYSNPINQAFFELEKEFSGGGFGIQQAYVITKPLDYSMK